MKKNGYLAFDFGASSGRLMLGTVVNGKMKLEEIHRFSNEPVHAGGTLYWDFLRLFHEMKQGLKKIAQRDDVNVKAIGIDTWGVDGAWLDANDRILSNPVHYRDDRTNEIMGDFYSTITDEKLYNITGIQKMYFNTIYQWYYDMKKNPTIAEKAKTWLFMPDLFGFLLTGEKYNEYTIASTGAVINAQTREYSQELFKDLGLPTDFLQNLVKPGTIVGTLTKEIQEETGLGAIPVVAVGSHDTASAVAGTPLASQNEVYLVCGTWCLMGMELDSPCINQASRDFNITNEGGVENKIRFLKNINGLWFLQQLRKGWNEQGKSLGFPDIIKEVTNTHHNYAVDAADPRFMAPISMEQEIINYCKETYDVELSTIGEIARAAYNGLAILYKKTIDAFEQITGHDINVVRMVGGGIQDQFLCQHVANTVKKEILAGPIEASALGNIVIQMKAVGEVEDLKRAREMIASSFEQKVYLPEE